MADKHESAFSAFLLAGGDASKLTGEQREAIAHMKDHETSRRGNAIRAIVKGDMKAKDYKG